MNESLTNLVVKLAWAGDDYPALFTKAFGSPEIMAEKISLALENYRLTLTSFDAKSAVCCAAKKKFTAAEQRGFELFSTEHDPRRGQFGAGFTFEFRRVCRFTSAECDHLSQSIYCCSPRCFF
ncbi:MAG TPA: hypothetical protein VIK53_18100 [Verrucomicrobiae bacterium]